MRGCIELMHPLFYVSFLLMNWNNEIFFVESYCSFIEKLI